MPTLNRWCERNLDHVSVLTRAKIFLIVNQYFKKYFLVVIVPDEIAFLFKFFKSNITLFDELYSNLSKFAFQ